MQATSLPLPEILSPQDSPDAHNVQAVSLAKQNRFEEAIYHFRKAVDGKPEWADAWANLGLALIQANKPEEAVEPYRQCFLRKSDSVEAANRLGVLLRNLKRLDEAVEVFEDLLKRVPDSAETWHHLGLTYAQQDKYQKAVASYQEALKHKPDFQEVQNNLGIAYQHERKYGEATRCFRQALRLKPDSPETLGNLGVVLAAQGRHHESLGYYYEALRRRPDSAETHNNLANALRSEGLAEEAIAHLKRALEINPSYHEAFNNLAIAHMQLEEYGKAVANYEKALKLKADYADPHMNRALAWLSRGDFERGWPEYEWRWQVGNLKPRPFSQPRWDGSPLDGRTILLWPEQGLGDTIQFVRYAALLKSQGKVVFECPKPLLRLLSRFPDVDQLVPERSPLPPFDVHCSLLSLPGLLKTALGNIPAKVPYMFADPQLVASWRGKLAGYAEFKVGIAWQGSIKYKGDRFRSVPLARFAPLAKVPGVRLIALQKGFGEEQMSYAGFPVTKPKGPVDEQAGPFMDTAAILSNLDLFITSDSSIAHLAGALGVPVWVALPCAPDWRWLQERGDSPWYPAMRLFRQQHRGDWDEVFDRMAEELTALIPPRPEGTDKPMERAADAWRRRGEELLKQGQLEEATTSLRKSLALQPLHVDVLHNLGVALARQQRRQEAIACFIKVVDRQPDSVDGHGNLGLAYLHQGQPQRAVTHLTRAVELRPNSAETLNNLGAAWNRLANPREAMVCFQKAVALRPEYAEAHVNLGRAQLALGLLPEAWNELEWRLKVPGSPPPPFTQPAWDGSPLEGKSVLLFAEAGMPDTFQYVRYARLVKQQGGTVLCQVPELLQSLVSTCPGVDRVVASVNELPSFDVQAGLPSLPAIFKTGLVTIPAEVPYVSADPTRVSAWRDKLPGGFRIGVACPNPGPDNLALRHFEPLTQFEGVVWCNVQKPAATSPLVRGKSWVELGAHIDEKNPFADWAAILSCVDLFITADGPLAHLAGALGVRTWLLLSAWADSRWFCQREDCPWYPSVRLFRKAEPGTWDGVFARIGTALRELLQSR